MMYFGFEDESGNVRFINNNVFEETTSNTV